MRTHFIVVLSKFSVPTGEVSPSLFFPIATGGVVAANRQAKEAGIEKFKSFFQVKALCEQKGIITLSSNYELYADLSSKMMQVISRLAPEQHM